MKLKIFLIVLFLSSLIACNWQDSATRYEIQFYKDFYDPYYNENMQSIVVHGMNNDYMITIDNQDQKNENYDVIITKLTGELCYRFNQLVPSKYLNSSFRGEMIENGLLCLYFEDWNTHNYSARINGALNKSIIIAIDINTWQILNQFEVSKNEMILTVRNKKTYLYSLGKILVRDFNTWSDSIELIDLGFEHIDFFTINILHFDIQNDIIVISTKKQNEKNSMMWLAKILFEENKMSQISINIDNPLHKMGGDTEI